MQCSRSCWSALDLTVTTWDCGSDSDGPKVFNLLAPWEDYLACFWRCTIAPRGPLQLFDFSVTHCTARPRARSV